MSQVPYGLFILTCFDAIFPVFHDETSRAVLERDVGVTSKSQWAIPTGSSHAAAPAKSERNNQSNKWESQNSIVWSISAGGSPVVSAVKSEDDSQFNERERHTANENSVGMFPVQSCVSSVSIQSVQSVSSISANQGQNNVSFGWGVSRIGSRFKFKLN